MAYTSEKIISDVEKNYPRTGELNLKSIADINVSISKTVLNQYIIGVTTGNFGSSESISQYEHWIKNQLSDVSQYVHCLPWFFEAEELDELRSTLSELADYYNANLDIEKMMKQAVKRDVRGYFIVITVVQTPIIYAQEG